MGNEDSEQASAAPVAGETLDLHALAAWMQARDGRDLPCLNPLKLEAGTQNLMIRFERGGQHYVLRQPPLHGLYPAAKLVAREASVLRALDAGDVPHPVVFGEHLEGNAPFYVMSAVNGFTATTGLPAHADAAFQQRMGMACVDTLQRLARFDAVAAGLGSLGKPDGFLERQVERWSGQLQSYRKFTGWEPEGALCHVEEIGAWLSDNRPETVSAGLIHGDFHLGNVMFDAERGSLAGVIDWELATLGDHLVDFGWLLATWPTADGKDTGCGIAVPGATDLPTPGQLIAEYERLSGRLIPQIRWYVVLACYKLGIIQEGSWARSLAGEADRAMGEWQHQRALAMIARGRELIRDHAGEWMKQA